MSKRPHARKQAAPKVRHVEDKKDARHKQIACQIHFLSCKMIGGHRCLSPSCSSESTRQKDNQFASIQALVCDSIIRPRLSIFLKCHKTLHSKSLLVHLVILVPQRNLHECILRCKPLLLSSQALNKGKQLHSAAQNVDTSPTVDQQAHLYIFFLFPAHSTERSDR